MTSSRKPGFVLPVAVTLAVLLGVYVGAYYATVEAWTTGDPQRLVVYRWLEFDWGSEPAVNAPWYRSRRWERFFAPIHWLDRRIRPRVWEPTP